jgi:hypothetical protein
MTVVILEGCKPYPGGTHDLAFLRNTARGTRSYRYNRYI